MIIINDPDQCDGCERTFAKTDLRVQYVEIGHDCFGGIYCEECFEKYA